MDKLNNRGGASLFVVIFTTLVLTIISVGFTQIMLRNQDQTQANDLSQRAYNSALAGVEDAKRALLALQEACASGTPACASIKTAIKNQTCGSVEQVLKGSDPATYRETTVGKTEDNQAYTCVKINTDTPDYEGSVSKNNATVIPIKGVGGFDTVTVSWFTKSDSGLDDDAPSLYTPNTPGKLELPAADQWNMSNPPILRVQYIPFGDNVSNLDSDAKTLFLYPFATVDRPSNSASFSTDQRMKKKAVLLPVSCYSSYTASTTGVCSVDLKVVSSGTITNGYLQLTSLYNDTHFTAKLSDSGAPVNFDNVEPSVDSTGRASDLFRRVVARVKIGGVPLAYPQGSLNTVGDLCKDFTLKDTYNQYEPGACSAATP